MGRVEKKELWKMVFWLLRLAEYFTIFIQGVLMKGQKLTLEEFCLRKVSKSHRNGVTEVIENPWIP